MSKNVEKYNTGRNRKDAANAEKISKFGNKSDKQLIKECIERYTLKTPVWEKVDLDEYMTDKDRIAENTRLMNKMSIPESLRLMRDSFAHIDFTKDVNPNKIKMLDKLVATGMLKDYTVTEKLDFTDFNRLIMSDVHFSKIYNGTILQVNENLTDPNLNTYDVSVDLDSLKGVRLLMTRNNMMRNTLVGDNEYCPGDVINVSFFKSSVGKVYPSEKAASRLKQYSFSFEPEMILPNVTIIKTNKLNCVQIHDYCDVRCMLENGSSFKYETGDLLNIKITTVKVDDTGVVLSGVSVK